MTSETEVTKALLVGLIKQIDELDARMRGSEADFETDLHRDWLRRDREKYRRQLTKADLELLRQVNAQLGVPTDD